MINTRYPPAYGLLLVAALLVIGAVAAVAQPVTYTVMLPHLVTDTALRHGVAVDQATGGAGVLIGGWGYDYMVSAPDDWPLGVQYVPMVWCTGHLDNFQAVQGPDYNGYLLWGNETDAGNQCGADPLTLYNTIRAAFPHARLIGPNCANTPCVASFVAAVQSSGAPLPHAVGIHSYAVSESHTHQTIINEVQAAIAAADGVPVWLTEFGFNMLTDGDYTYSATLANRRANELAQLLDWLNSSAVERWAYYAPRHDCVNQSGWCASRFTDLYWSDWALTPVGVEYQK